MGIGNARDLNRFLAEPLSFWSAEFMQDWKDHADWQLIPEYMRPAIMAYVDYGQPGAEFVEALFSNQFTLVCLTADMCNRQRLYDYATFLVGHVPALCQGSPRAYADWIEIGGLTGVAKQIANHI